MLLFFSSLALGWGRSMYPKPPWDKKDHIIRILNWGLAMLNCLSKCKWDIFILVLVLEFPVWDRVIIHCSEKKMSNAREKSFSNWVVFQAFGKSDKKQWRGSFTCRKTVEGMDFDRASSGTWLAAQEVIENPLSSLGLENYWSPTKSARYGWKVKRSFWWPRAEEPPKSAQKIEDERMC